jgi:hypothetical protein
MLARMYRTGRRQHCHEDLERQVTNKFSINHTQSHTRRNVVRNIKGLKPTKLVSIAPPISYNKPISQCLQLNASITDILYDIDS